MMSFEEKEGRRRRIGLDIERVAYIAPDCNRALELGTCVSKVYISLSREKVRKGKDKQAFAC